MRLAPSMVPSSSPYIRKGVHTSPPAPLIRKGVQYGADNSIISCVFCQIMSKDAPGKIELENEKFVIFRTIKPYARTHLICCPRSHIETVHSLKGADDANLVEEMVSFGKDALTILEPNEKAKFCFHIPPFNSINHLHLHCIAPVDQMSWLGYLKYYEGSFYCHSARSIINALRINDNDKLKMSDENSKMAGNANCGPASKL